MPRKSSGWWLHQDGARYGLLISQSKTSRGLSPGGQGARGRRKKPVTGWVWGNSCGSPPRAPAGPPPPLLCVFWSGGGARRTAPLVHSSHSLMGTPPWPGCLQLLQGAPSRWLCLQRCCGELDQSQRPVWAVLEPGWWFFVVVVFVFLFVCFLTGSSEKQR